MTKMKRVLAIGAHYDDVELGCGGTLLKHVQNGDPVYVLVITDSAYTDANGILIRDTKTAYEEGQKAARLMNVEMDCLNYKTFEVPFDEGLTRLIIRYIQERNIDTVYTHWVRDVHRDHQYAARCTLMAARHVPNILMYRSNFYNADQPFLGTLYSDISHFMEKKCEVIRAYTSELTRVNYAWLDFVRKRNSSDGQIVGVEYAENFEITQYMI
jgi:LmbE family N-acetylglucosaminyl deacetylase